MRRTRFMSVLFLVLSAAYFAMPQFRQVFELPWLVRTVNAGRIPEIAHVPHMDQWKSDAESRHDARVLSFIALYTPDMTEATRLADMAIAADPKYGWIYYHLFARKDMPKTAAGLAFAKKVQAFDPDNAVGSLMEAEHVWGSSEVFKKLLQPTKPDYEQSFVQTDWRLAMEKAYAAKKYDSYVIARFDLDRHILHEHNLDRPIRVLLMVATYPFPNLLNLRDYDNLRVNYQGKTAEAAGKSKEALDHYWAVARFGEHMQLGSGNLLEQVVARSVQNAAYKPLIEALRKNGDIQAADSVQYSSDSLQRHFDAIDGKDILVESSTYTWSTILVSVFLGLTVIFAVLTVLSILYVNLKRWWRAHKTGAIYGGITIAENYLPILLFIFCTGLYISYYPYAHNFQHYMTAVGQMHDTDAMFSNTITLPIFMPGYMQLGVGNPFVPYIWYALGGIALVVAAQFILPERKPEEQLNATAARN